MVQFVPHSKHIPFGYYNPLLNDVYRNNLRSEIRTKHMNIRCGKKVAFLNGELDDTCTNYGDLTL